VLSTCPLRSAPTNRRSLDHQTIIGLKLQTIKRSELTSVDTVKQLPSDDSLWTSSCRSLEYVGGRVLVIVMVLSGVTGQKGIHAEMTPICFIT
jgi:hypothetical protein